VESTFVIYTFSVALNCELRCSMAIEWRPKTMAVSPWQYKATSNIGH